MAEDNKKIEDFFGDFDWEESSDNSFGLDEESGELNLPNKSGISNDLKEDDSDDAVAENEEVSDASDGDNPNSGVIGDPVEAKFKELESSFNSRFDALLGTVEKIASHIQNGNGKQEVEEIEDDWDFSDSSSMKKAMKKMIQESIQESIAPLQQQTKEAKLTAEVNRMVQIHGQAFRDAIPNMQAVLQINPEMGIENAYNLVTKIKGVKTPTATKQDSDGKQTTTTPKTVVKKSAADLVNKAANLETAKGVSVSKEKKRAANFNDAIENAFSSVFST